MKLRILTVAVRAVLLTALVVALSAFGACGRNARPDLPRGAVVVPKAVPVVRTEYVNVPPEFTDPLPIAEGALALCPDVAAARKKQLIKANADRKATRALSGTEKKP